jgi:hypothetical protein
VSRLRKMSEADFLTAGAVDFSREAIVRGYDAAFSDADVIVRSYAEDEQRIEVRAPGQAFVASSEKLTPELRVTIDGRDVKPVEINMLFAGVPVPAGAHQVIFSRRIGRGWWWVSVAAAIASMALSIIDVVRR